MPLKHQLLRLFGHLRWLRFGLRDRLIRRFHPPEGAAAFAFDVSFFSKRYTGHTSSFLDWTVFYYGAYEWPVLQLMRDVLQQHKTPVFFDVGANVGHHSLFASHCGAQVIAAEPVPELYRQLVARFAQNEVENAKLLNVALGERRDSLRFRPSATHNQGTGRVVQSADDTFSTDIEVAVDTGDALVVSLSPAGVHFIKIDVEGYEPFVLPGLHNTITTHRPVVCLEWSADSIQNAEGKPISDFFPPGYALFRLPKSRPWLFFFEKPNYRLEKAAATFPEAEYVAVPTEQLDGRRLRINTARA